MIMEKKNSKTLFGVYDSRELLLLSTDSAQIYMPYPEREIITK